jgi:peroxiredoxin family protein
LAGLRDTAFSLEDLELYACSASMETMAVDRAQVEGRLDGVMSTPAFLKKAASAQIIFV